MQDAWPACMVACMCMRPAATCLNSRKTAKNATRNVSTHALAIEFGRQVVCVHVPLKPIEKL